MNGSKIIKSVTDFIKEIFALEEKQDHKHDCFFYRGLPSASYKLRPPLFRKTDYPAKEKLLMQELLSRQAPAFTEDKTMFERLVRAQHYELPTRLMDVTDNPLIALYFACADWKTGKVKETEENGKVVIFCQKRQNIHYFNSHRTKLLSNLAHLSQSQKEELRASLKPEHSPKKEQKTSNIKDNSISFQKGILEDIKPLKNPKALKELFGFIQNEYSGFRDEINIEDLRSPILVIPQQNNERIIAQHGAFILFGLDERTLEENDLEKHLFGEIKSFEIEFSEKENILKELKTLGIHLHTLLPGIEHCAHYLIDLLETKEENTPEENFNRGLMYYNGNGVQKDLGKAREYWEKAADQGDATAQYNLGFMYAEGKGVPQNYQKALEYWEKAAKQGASKAQCALGIMYCFGRGVQQNLKKAREYYEKAANQGDSQAQYNLGCMYKDGSAGPKDDQKAFELWKKAAEQGNLDAQHNLAVAYATGDGVQKDLGKARYWYSKAADQGNEASINALKMLNAEEVKNEAQASDKEPPKGDKKPDA